MGRRKRNKNRNRQNRDRRRKRAHPSIQIAASSSASDSNKKSPDTDAKHKGKKDSMPNARVLKRSMADWADIGMRLCEVGVVVLLVLFGVFEMVGHRFAALWLACAAICLTVVGFACYLHIRWAKELSGIADSVPDHEQLELTREQIRVAKDKVTLEKRKWDTEHRAEIVLKVPDVAPPEAGKPASATFQFRNVGKSPAKVRAISNLVWVIKTGTDFHPFGRIDRIGDSSGMFFKLDFKQMVAKLRAGEADNTVMFIMQPTGTPLTVYGSTPYAIDQAMVDGFKTSDYNLIAGQGVLYTDDTEEMRVSVQLWVWHSDGKCMPLPGFMHFD